MHRTIKRGDMFFADLGPVVGSEQDGVRPVLIIQNNIGNKHSKTVIVAVITSRTLTKPKLPTHILLSPKQGIEKDSIVMLEQIRTLDKSRLGAYIGYLDYSTMKMINEALCVSMGLHFIAEKECL